MLRRRGLPLSSFLQESFRSYGYEVTIALTSPHDPGDDFRKLPCSALGMTVHKPSENPGGHLLRVLNNIGTRADPGMHSGGPPWDRRRPA